MATMHHSIRRVNISCYDVCNVNKHIQKHPVVSSPWPLAPYVVTGQTAQNVSSSLGHVTWSHCGQQRICSLRQTANFEREAPVTVRKLSRCYR
jgi:hypothetical protein